MKVKLSQGNSKIGGTLNISLPPGKTCRKDALCYEDGCYARNSYRQYPNVRKAWNHNLDFFNLAPDAYFESIMDNTHKANFLRWHVSGDIINQPYLNGMMDVADYEPLTNFLAFTKKYNLDFSDARENLQIVFSIWPGMELPESHDVPWAWLEEDTRRPADALYLMCPGKCAECGHKCWTHLSKDLDVVFARH